MRGVSIASVDVPRLEVRLEDAGAGLAAGVVRMSVQGDCQGLGTPLLGGPLGTLGLEADVGSFSLGSRVLSDGDLRLSVNKVDVLAAQVAHLDMGALDLRGWMRAVLDPSLAVSAHLLPEGAMRGNPVRLTMEYDGRLPDVAQLRSVAADPRLDTVLERMLVGLRSLRAELDMESLDVRVAGLDLRGLHLAKPLILAAGARGESISLAGELAVSEIHGLPALESQAALPLGTRFSARLEHGNVLRMEHETHVPALGLLHRANLRVPDLGGLLDSFLAQGVGGALRRGDLEFSTSLSAHPRENFSVAERVAIAGALSAELTARLTGGKSIAVQCRARTKDADVGIGNRFSLERMDGGYSFQRTYRIVGEDVPEASGEERRAHAPGLSRRVLDDGNAFGSMADELFARRVNRDLRGRTTDMRTLTCARLSWAGPPVPMRLENLEIQVDEEDGLPSVQFFQVSALGGSVQGGAFLAAEGSGSGNYSAALRCAFTGLDAERLLPGDVERLENDDTEISGQLVMDLPLSTDPTHMLENSRLRLDITHIGARTLERMLRSLDPYEANRTIVEQRKLLRLGTPQNVRLSVASGNLSLSGQVAALGVRLDLPRLTRFNLAGLPVHDMLARRLAAVEPVVRILDMLTADELQTTSDGAIRLGRSDRNPHQRGGS